MKYLDNENLNFFGLLSKIITADLALANKDKNIIGNFKNDKADMYKHFNTVNKPKSLNLPL
jgi:hypothetical protein